MNKRDITRRSFLRCGWRIVISPTTGMSQCYIPSLYVVHFKGALNSGEAVVFGTLDNTPVNDDRDRLKSSFVVLAKRLHYILRDGGL